MFSYKALLEFLKDNGFEVIKAYTVINNWPKEYSLLHHIEKFLITINKSLGSGILVIGKKV